LLPTGIQGPPGGRGETGPPGGPQTTKPGQQGPPPKQGRRNLRGAADLRLDKRDFAGNPRGRGPFFGGPPLFRFGPVGSRGPRPPPTSGRGTLSGGRPLADSARDTWPARFPPPAPGPVVIFGPPVLICGGRVLWGPQRGGGRGADPESEAHGRLGDRGKKRFWHPRSARASGLPFSPVLPGPLPAGRPPRGPCFSGWGPPFGAGVLPCFPNGDKSPLGAGARGPRSRGGGIPLLRATTRAPPAGKKVPVGPEKSAPPRGLAGGTKNSRPPTKTGPGLVRFKRKPSHGSSNGFQAGAKARPQGFS